MPDSDQIWHDRAEDMNGPSNRSPAHGTMVHFMWQADLFGVAQFVTDCLDAYYIPDPKRVVPTVSNKSALKVMPFDPSTQSMIASHNGTLVKSSMVHC